MLKLIFHRSASVGREKMERVAPFSTSDSENSSGRKVQVLQVPVVVTKVTVGFGKQHAKDVKRKGSVSNSSV